MNKESGIVLLIVVVIVAILSTLVVDFMYFIQVDTEISANTRDDIKAKYIAKSGVNVVAGTIKDKSLEELKGEIGLLTNQGVEIDEDWAINVPFFPVGDGNVSLHIVDERSKINLNALISPSANLIDNQVYVELNELFKFLGVDAKKSGVFIGSLINWLDRPVQGKKNDQDSSGANTEHYQSLEKPIKIKDGPLDSLDEIRMIQGMDVEFFEKIKDYVTVYPVDKKVNFSTASRAVMFAALKGAIVPTLQKQEGAKPEDLKDSVAERIVDDIIEARKENAVIDRQKVTEIVNNVDPTLRMNAGLSGVVFHSGQSDVFRVTSIGSIGEDNPTIRAVEAVLRNNRSSSHKGVEIITWKET